MSAKPKPKTIEQSNIPAKLLRQYGCGAIQFTGTDDAL